jgi:hypothetical protein
MRCHLHGTAILVNGELFELEIIVSHELHEFVRMNLLLILLHFLLGLG